MRTRTLNAIVPSPANRPTSGAKDAVGASSVPHRDSGTDQFNDQAVDLRRLLHLRHMPGIGQNMDTDARRQAFGVAHGEYLVVGTPDDLYGNGPELRQPVTQDLLLSIAGEIGRRDRTERRTYAVEALVLQQLFQHGLQLLAAAGGNEFGDETAVDLLAESGRTDQAKRCHMRWLVECRPQCNRPAQRMPDQMRLWDVERGQQSNHRSG